MNNSKINFTEEELLDIHKYEAIIDSSFINNEIKQKLLQTPPPKYYEYLSLKKKLTVY